MNRNGSEALVRQGSSVWRWAGAMFAAVAMSAAVAPAFAADVKSLDLRIVQTSGQANYGGSATYTVTLTNVSGKTVNNASIAVTAPSTGMDFFAAPTCTLSTGLPCTSSGTATSFGAAGYQLPASASLKITVGLFMPQPAATPPGFHLSATGTTSNNATGPKDAAYTTTFDSLDTAFAPPPPSYPNIRTSIDHFPGNTVVWSTADCGTTAASDCGETYYAQYLITVKNLDASNAIPSTRPITLTLTGATLTDAVDCLNVNGCSRSANVFTIAGLGADASTSFTVFFKTPQKPLLINVIATATVDTPAYVLPAPASNSAQTTPVDVPTELYSSLVPTVGGSAKAKNALNPNGTAPFSSRVDVPGYTLGSGLGTVPKPIDIVLKVKPGTTSCSSWSPSCLETEIFVQSNGTSVTFGENTPLNGSQLVITMVRDVSTLNKKPSSVFNATVWYTDDDLNRTLIKNCDSVNLMLADRCVAQRIDMTGTAPDGTRIGYIKFIIWARHNGKIGY
jgi:uncharacterized repeat protein (TIGR01451 family)